MDILSKLPTGGKLVISEVTPRQKKLDEAVMQCNKHLYNFTSGNNSITLARHSNLRNNEWSFHKKGDDKHLEERSIARFASNLKIAFRKAIGIRSQRTDQQKDSRNDRVRSHDQPINIKNLLKKELLKLLNQK